MAEVGRLSPFRNPSDEGFSVSGNGRYLAQSVRSVAAYISRCCTVKNVKGCKTPARRVLAYADRPAVGGWHLTTLNIFCPSGVKVYRASANIRLAVSSRKRSIGGEHGIKKPRRSGAMFRVKPGYPVVVSASHRRVVITNTSPGTGQYRARQRLSATLEG